MAHVDVASCTWNILSLCSGVGGLDVGVDLALERLGERSRTVCMVERDAFTAALLVARMEDAYLDPAPIWDDLKTFDGAAWRGLVDLVVAGIPCQGHSHAGKRAGAEDPRNLWPATRKLLREVQPKLFFLENVDGIAAGKHPYIQQVAEDLRDDGWTAFFPDEADLPSALAIPALAVGAPHKKRMRVFLLAYSERPRLQEWQDGSGNLDQGREAAQFSAFERGGGTLESERSIPDPECLLLLREQPGRLSGAGGSGPALIGERSAPWEPPLFPPRRDQLAEWREILAARPDLEPSIRRMAPRGSPRTDRIRALGNFCISTQAALAFVTLWTRLGLEELSWLT